MILLKKRIVQFLEYMVGGATYFWSGYLIFVICYSGFHWKWLPAKLLSDIVGCTLTYLIHGYWGFASPSLKSKEGSTIAKYGLLTIVNLGFDYLIIWSLQLFGISPYIGFFISAGF